VETKIRALVDVKGGTTRIVTGSIRKGSHEMQEKPATGSWDWMARPRNDISKVLQSEKGLTIKTPVSRFTRGVEKDISNNTKGKVRINIYSFHHSGGKTLQGGEHAFSRKLWSSKLREAKAGPEFRSQRKAVKEAGLRKVLLSAQSQAFSEELRG